MISYLGGVRIPPTLGCQGSMDLDKWTAFGPRDDLQRSSCRAPNLRSKKGALKHQLGRRQAIYILGQAYRRFRACVLRRSAISLQCGTGEGNFGFLLSYPWVLHVHNG